VEHDISGKSKPKKRTAAIIGLSLTSLLILFIAVAVSKSPLPATLTNWLSDKRQASPRPAKITNAGVDSTPSGPLDLKGSGSKQTQQFTTTKDWDLVWSYDCSKTNQANFIVTVYDSKGRVSRDTPPVIKFEPKGSGVQPYHKPGPHFLGINSRCDWHVMTRPASSPNPSASP